jgi:hypothetical protein
MGTDRQMDGRTDRRTDAVSYRGATSRLKKREEDITPVYKQTKRSGMKGKINKKSMQRCGTLWSGILPFWDGIKLLKYMILLCQGDPLSVKRNDFRKRVASEERPESYHTSFVEEQRRFRQRCDMYTTCERHVHNIGTACTQLVKGVYKTCERRVRNVWTACICTTCEWHHWHVHNV